ncbi:MAG: MarR family transcriptional regulator [Nanoarchaeota archaeon]
MQNNKAIFQAELIEKTKFGKAKITRILDRLEGKGFVERKRRGMTNIVVLRE